MLLSPTMYWLLQNRPHEIGPPLLPKFHAKQCFVNIDREPWQAEVAGIVVQRGSRKYLVMYAKEADRRAITKEGWEEWINEFDRRYELTECPVAWITNPLTKPRRNDG